MTVSVGSQAPATLGMDALLDFEVRVTLDGQPAHPAAEIRALLASSEGLVLLKGRWVEVDRAAALRGAGSVAGASSGRPRPRASASRRPCACSPARASRARQPSRTTAREAWSEVVAGKWLVGAARGPARARAARGHRGQRRPRGHPAALPEAGRPLARHPPRARPRRHPRRRHGPGEDHPGAGDPLPVPHAAGRRAPTCWWCRRRSSTTGAWRSRASRRRSASWWLTPRGCRRPSSRRWAGGRLAAHDAVITTYGTAMRLGWIARDHLAQPHPRRGPGHQEPRRQADQARSRRCGRGWRLALTGTPVENRLGDLWSLFDFLNPGLLGSAKAFNRHVPGHGPGGPGGYAPLRRLVQPYILRRLKTDKRVIADLPDKTELTAHCLPEPAPGGPLPAVASTSCGARSGIARASSGAGSSSRSSCASSRSATIPPSGSGTAPTIRRTAGSSPGCASCASPSPPARTRRWCSPSSGS